MESSKVSVIGGANIDLYVRSTKELVLRDSNPALMELGFGGVGRNIAENLIKHNEEVEFISIFADDYFGGVLYEDCLKKGLKLNYSLKKKDFNTSMYLAILDRENDLYLGMSDMRIIESLTIKDLEKLKDTISDDDYLVVDTNLNEEMISCILNEFKGIKVSDAISANKVHRLKNNLNRIDILKLNLIEAETLSQMKLESLSDLITVMKHFDDLGCKDVIITVKEGAYLLKEHKMYYYTHNAYIESLKNATGAGDSFLGAYIHMHHCNSDIKEAISYALATSLLTIEDSQTVGSFNQEDIFNKMKTLKITGGIINENQNER